jgi:hypothetical protein
MPPVGFEPVVLASEWPQPQALHRAVTGIGVTIIIIIIVMMIIIIIIIIIIIQCYCSFYVLLPL